VVDRAGELGDRAFVRSVGGLPGDAVVARGSALDQPGIAGSRLAGRPLDADPLRGELLADAAESVGGVGRARHRESISAEGCRDLELRPGHLRLIHAPELAVLLHGAGPRDVVADRDGLDGAGLPDDLVA